MATEVSSNTFATPSTITDDELVRLFERGRNVRCVLTVLQNANPNTSQRVDEHVFSTVPAINGVHDTEDRRQDAENTESNAASAEVSVSGGSDTEASKAGNNQSTADDKGHLRTDSKVKKFASFKSVSVNKTFLAAKTPGTATPSKLGEKISLTSTTTPAGPNSTTLRPRLVAKTGSGLRDATSKSALGVNGVKPGAPDASAVWNKNRRM